MDLSVIYLIKSACFTFKLKLIYTNLGDKIITVHLLC